MAKSPHHSSFDDLLDAVGDAMAALRQMPADLIEAFRPPIGSTAPRGQPSTTPPGGAGPGPGTPPVPPAPGTSPGSPRGQGVGASEVRGLLGRVFDLAPSPIAQGFASALHKTRGWVDLGREFDRMAGSAKTATGAIAPRAAAATIGAGAVGGIAGVALIETLGRLKDSSDRQVDAMQRFGVFNANIAGASMALELGDLRRLMRGGSAVEGSATALMRSTNVLRDAMLPLETTLTNLKNVVGAFAAGVGAQVAPDPGVLARAGDAIVGMVGKRIGQGAGGALGDVLGPLLGQNAMALLRGEMKRQGLDPDDMPNILGAGVVGALKGALGFGPRDKQGDRQFGLEGLEAGAEAAMDRQGGALRGEHQDAGNPAAAQPWFNTLWFLGGVQQTAAQPLRPRREINRNANEWLGWLQQNMDPLALSQILQFNARNAQGHANPRSGFIDPD